MQLLYNKGIAAKGEFPIDIFSVLIADLLRSLALLILNLSLSLSKISTRTEPHNLSTVNLPVRGFEHVNSESRFVLCNQRHHTDLPFLEALKQAGGEGGLE